MPYYIDSVDSYVISQRFFFKKRQLISPAITSCIVDVGACALEPRVWQGLREDSPLNLLIDLYEFLTMGLVGYESNSKRVSLLFVKPDEARVSRLH